MWAADSETYSRNLMKSFLERKDVDWYNDENYSDNLMKSFLERKDVDWYNDENYSDNLMKSFLERKDVDVNCRDKDGRTALMWAAGTENYDVVEKLLQRDGIDLTGSDEDEESLRYAIDFLNLSI